jgi:hypothetical protein
MAAMAVSLAIAGQAQAPASPDASSRKPSAAAAQAPDKAPAQQAFERARRTLSDDYKVPRTPWGDPDLQGVWSYATTTPLSARGGADDRLLTDEEIAEEAERTSQRQDAPPPPGDPGTYNDFWWDRGVSVGRPSLIIDPPDGRLPPLTDEARKQRAARAAYQKEHPADSWLDRSPTDRCIMYHGVPPLPSGYSNTYQIVQAKGLVAIYDEEIHHVRMVPLDGRPFVDERIRRWNGDSIGRWEGDTLVVETRGFNDQTRLRYGGSATTHAVERFKRVGPDLIDYQYTITDPQVYTRPFTVAIPMPRRDDKVYEYACHENNYALPNILSGQRAEEAAAAARKGSSR